MRDNKNDLVLCGNCEYHVSTVSHNTICLVTVPEEHWRALRLTGALGFFDWIKANPEKVIAAPLGPIRCASFEPYNPF